MENKHIYAGDNSRLKTLFAKAARNEPLSLVFLGASVTLGFRIEMQHRFSTAVKQHFEQAYGCTNVQIHNLSTAGMPSLHGLYLSYLELEEKKPDLIVIDYSINDQKSPVFQDSYESLLIRCLSMPTKPAVFSFCLQNLDGYTCAPQIGAVSKHYGVPYVHVGSWLMEDIQKGLLRWENYSYDDRHPGPFGNTYIGKCLTRFLEEMAKCDTTPIPFPAKPLFHCTLSQLKPILTDWKSTAHASELLWEQTICCRSLFAVYEVNTVSDYGKLEVVVDDTVHVLDSYRVHEWHHDHPEVIYLSREKQPHHIQIRTTPENMKKIFYLKYLGADF